MNNPDIVQAELVAIMISTERENSVFALDSADAALSEFLDQGYYDLLVSICSINAEKMKNKTEHDNIELTTIEIGHLISYKTMLKEQIATFKAQGLHLRDQYSNLASRSATILNK